MAHGARLRRGPHARPYLTTSLANTLATGNLHAPDLGTFAVGTAISLVGLLAGRAIGRLRRRAGGDD